jgi:hypothetical protein
LALVKLTVFLVNDGYTPVVVFEDLNEITVIIVPVTAPVPKVTVVNESVYSVASNKHPLLKTKHCPVMYPDDLATVNAV